MLFWLFIIILIVVGLLIRNISFDFEIFGEVLIGFSGLAAITYLILMYGTI